MIEKGNYIELHRKHSYSFDYTNMISNDDWKKIITAYNNFELSESILIPKKIHQIWLGGELPDRYKRLTDSWLKYNPDWEHKLWKDADIAELELVNQSAYNMMKNVGMKSDLLRFEILNKFGGMYADTDFECLKPLEELHRLSFYSGVVYGKGVEVAIGLMGSTPNHPILTDYLTNFCYIGETVNNIFNTSGTYYFTKVFLRNITIETKDIVAFPTIYFYPFHSSYYPQRLLGFDEGDKALISKFFTEDSYATHWWHVSWNH